jgi:spermidine synthase
LLTLTLAFLSGIPALVYQVVWTREIVLLAGSQIEAISVVLVAFFGGLAVGARAFGGVVDRFSTPLRIYGCLEIGAGLLAALAMVVLHSIGNSPIAAGSLAVLLLSSAAVLFPVTVLLGGTLPALLRSAVRDLSGAASRAGLIVGTNTAGSVLGVGAAVLLVPAVGLRATQLGAAFVAVIIGVAAIGLARGRSRPALAPQPGAGMSSLLVLAAAAAAGVATLAYEVLAARMAALWLGSSLYAWGSVLALVLVGLAAGNLALAGRAARSADPRADLGWIEVAAAAALGAGLLAISPPIALPAAGLTANSLSRVALGVFPPAFLMGGAFPFFVRLGVRDPRLGTTFGAVSAANTAGGIAGALLAPFALLPALGLAGGTLACAGLNGALGLAFLARASEPRRRGAHLVVAAAALAAATFAGTRLQQPATAMRVLHVDHGRQATTAVIAVGDRRDLIVDGDPEASTVGEALVTEELLAVLPLLLHPDPKTFFEVGLGSGITLGTAARFPLDRLDCAEIADSVIGAVGFFTPQNGGVHDGGDSRVRIFHTDGRAHLLRHRSEYDVIVGNTLHPWSIGATGLYSKEYFERLRAALRPGGVAVQWVPAARLGDDNLAAIVRTFYAVFPEGSMWWGATNMMLVGSETPGLRVDEARFEALRPRMAGLLQRLGIRSARELEARRFATAASVREALGPGLTLSDDRPVLEVSAARNRPTQGEPATELALLQRLAEAGVAGSPEIRDGMRLWVQSLRARERGAEAQAERLEREAEAAGFGEGRRLRLYRIVGRGTSQREAGRFDRAEREYRRALAEDAELADALFGLAAVHAQRGHLDNAISTLERLVHLHPGDAAAWNLLGVLQGQAGDAAGARMSFDRAVEASPYFTGALANAGLLAAEQGDARRARELLARLQAISPLATYDEERALAEALNGL